jgi:iron complex outermembrane receptor protein
MDMSSMGLEPSNSRVNGAGASEPNAATASTLGGRLVRRMRREAFASAAAAALLASLIAAPALAQTVVPAPAATPEAAAVSEIVVTGTRIQTTGFTAPTPTSVIGEAQIQNNAQPNVFATIVQLPSLQGSSGSTTNTFSTSSGQQGLSSFSLRGLGTIRTLTLLDGQRVVGAYYTGVTDVSLFPQLLIQRVDVVNGGASASYGSDAVGGVVNFITDTRFTGRQRQRPGRDHHLWRRRAGPRPTGRGPQLPQRSPSRGRERRMGQGGRRRPGRLWPRPGRGPRLVHPDDDDQPQRHQ